MIGEQDKRAFHRMMIDAEVTLNVYGQTCTAVCKDLSATGISFSLAEVKLAVDDEVNLSLRGNGVPPLSADGKVVRADGDIYAVEFTSVS